MENNSPNEFFDEIWLIYKECKNNYIAEVKPEKKLLGYDFSDKNKFWIPLDLLLFAN